MSEYANVPIELLLMLGVGGLGAGIFIGAMLESWLHDRRKAREAVADRKLAQDLRLDTLWSVYQLAESKRQHEVTRTAWKKQFALEERGEKAADKKAPL